MIGMESPTRMRPFNLAHHLHGNCLATRKDASRRNRSANARCRRTLASPRQLRTLHKILGDARMLCDHSHQLVFGSTLDKLARLPTRDSGLSHAQQILELSLSQAEGHANPANLFRRQKAMTAPIFLVYSPREQIPLIRSIFDPAAGIANIMLDARDEETLTSKLGIYRIAGFTQFRTALHASHVHPSNPQSRRSLNAPCRQDSTTIRLRWQAHHHHPRRTLRTIAPLRRTSDRYRRMCLASSQADPISENRFGRGRAVSLLPYRLEDSRDCEATCGPVRNSGIFRSEPTTARHRDHKTASSKHVPRRLHK